MEPAIFTSSSPPDPRSLVLPPESTSPYLSKRQLTNSPKMPTLRALESLRDSHLGPMSPRLEISHPPTPGPSHGYDAEHDERREARADGDNPFPIDRAIPVPFIYAYDSDPYNKLGGEYIIMSKAPGVPLIRQFHSMPPSKVQELIVNLANMLVPLSTQAFPAIGSLYQTSELCPPKDVVRSMLRRARMGIEPGTLGTSGAGLHVPQLRTHMIRPSPLHETATLPSPTSPAPTSPSPWSVPSTPAPGTYTAPKTSDFYVGPIVAWPFFGSGRGELPSVNRPFVPLSPSTPTSSLPSTSQLHHSRPGTPPNALQFTSGRSSPIDQDPDEVDRGPFKTFGSYARACARREVAGVRREQEKAGAAHKPHMIPASEEHHGHHGHHHHGHGHGRKGHDLHMLHPPSKVRKKRARSGLGALGDGRGPGRRVKSGLGSLGNGDGPLPSLSMSASTSSSDSESDSDASTCSCSDSSCSCSSSSGPEEDVVSDEDEFYSDYRNAQRSSLFVGLNFAREGAVRAEMDRWVGWMSGMNSSERIEEEEESEESDADGLAAGVGSSGFLGVGNGAPLISKPTPSKLTNSTSPRGVGVGAGGFIGVGPAVTSTVVSPPRPRGAGVGAGGFVGVGPASPLSPASPTPISIPRGVGVGGGGFVGVGPGVVPPPPNTQSGTGFVGVGVGSTLGGIPSPPSPSSPEESSTGYGQGFGGGVGVGGGGFLSVAAPMSPPKSKAPLRGLGIGGGGFLSLGHVPEEKKEKKEKKKREVTEEKDELGNFVLDLHDLSLANIFVDPVDSSKITCIIDWESTTIRPFWQAAHLPTFLVSATHAHSHPVTPRMQSRPSYSHRPSYPDSRPSHPDSRSSHRALGGLEAHLPPNGATSGMASIAALTAALNDYAQNMYSPRYDSPRLDSPRVGGFEDSPRHGHHDSPAGDEMDGDVESPAGSAPRTAVLSVRHGMHHSYSYPNPRRKSGSNTAVNSIRPGGMFRTMSQRTPVHAHFGDDEGDHQEHEHEGRAFRGRERTREEAAEYFKRVAAEIRCSGDGKRETCGERWVRAERERAAWRVAHKAVEWDGWELGLVESVLEDARTLAGDMDF
ncbi:hypothetical protein FRC07_006895 [Ceratobasidium sp. 392]|nr:hypothetical protein FRC07_006895 [Ceratobasidium sp. 392]